MSEPLTKAHLKLALDNATTAITIRASIMSLGGLACLLVLNPL